VDGGMSGRLGRDRIFGFHMRHDKTM
jgi:hypothetical protein